jgi:BASS family bile acid:Na+ symporter
MLANYVCVPAATIGLLLVFNAHPLVATGFLILAVCPGAPYGPPFTTIAKGNVSVAVGLMVLLAGSSAVIAPLLLRCLLPLISKDGSVDIDMLKIVTTLFAMQLLPLSAGMALRHWCPQLAQRLQAPANQLSKILNLVTVSLIIVAQFHLLIEIQLRSFGGMFVLLLVSWTSGWLLGGRNVEIRKAVAVTTSLRNVAVGLVVAAGSFAGTPALTSVVSYGLISLLGTLALSLLLGSAKSHVRPTAGLD